MCYRVAQSEIEFSAIRAQGPGGQHVNKASTAVHLRFDIRASGLPEAAKARLLGSGDSRISGDGVLIIKAQAKRSLEGNKAEAVARLQQIIDRALLVPKRRKATQPSHGSKQRRLKSKARRALVKSTRGRVAE